MPLSPTTPMTPVTPGPVPPMRARSDDQEPQPTPKKLKSEHENTPRRPALRDVTNELRTAKGPRSAIAVKDQARHSARKPRTVESGAVEVSTVNTEEPCETEVAALIATTGATEAEFLAFDHLVGRDGEDELAAIMYTQLLDKQTRYAVSVNYFENDVQPHINAKMRSILVDWLIEIHYRLKLDPETLFLAINYIDRYLACAVTTRAELQLVGVTALFMAAKFEEVEPIDLSDLSYVTDKTYTGEQIIAMERKILDVLQFNISAATTHAFVEHFSHKLGFDRQASLLAAFLTQSTLHHLPFLACYRPVDRAAAAVFLASCATAGERPNDEWIAEWEAMATNCLEDLLPCIHDVCKIMAHPSKKLTALRTKFGTKRFGRVANKPLDILEKFL